MSFSATNVDTIAHNALHEFAENYVHLEKKNLYKCINTKFIEAFKINTSYQWPLQLQELFQCDHEVQDIS